MRIKKAVLLVLNNKTKGSVIGTNGVHAVLNPVKRKGTILSEGGVIQNLNPLFADIVTSTDVFNTILIANRSFTNDGVSEIDVVNLNFNKPFSENNQTTDLLIATKGKGVADILLTSENVEKDLSKLLQDIDVSIEKFTFTLNKPAIDEFITSEIFVKSLSKDLQENVQESEFFVLELAKPFAENIVISDSKVLFTGKAINEVNDVLESKILEAVKALSENVLLEDIPQKSVLKVFDNETVKQDSVSIAPQKNFSDLLSISEFIIKQIDKKFVEINDVLETTIFSVLKSLVNTADIIDTPQKTVTKPQSDVFSQIDSVVTLLARYLTVSDETFTSELVIREFTKGLEDIGVNIEVISFDSNKVLLDINGIVQQIVKDFTKVLGPEVAENLDAPSKDFTKALSTSNTKIYYNELATKQFNKRVLDDTIQVEIISKFFEKIASPDFYAQSDETAKAFTKANQDELSQQDSLLFSVAKTLTDVVTSLDVLTITRTLASSFVDLILNVSATALNFSKFAQDQVQTTDVFNRLLIINRLIQENDFQDYVDNNDYFLEDYVASGRAVRHQDSLSFNAGKALSDTHDQIEKLIYDANKVLSDLIERTEENIFDVTSVRTDTFTSLDTPTFDTDTNLSDNTNKNDAALRNFEKALSDIASYTDNFTFTLFVGLVFTKTVSDIVQLSDNINISTNKGLVDVSQLSNTGLLLSQNYVENGTAGYDAEGYFAEVYVDNSLKYFSEEYVEEGYLQDITGNYFAEDYVGESRILT